MNPLRFAPLSALILLTACGGISDGTLASDLTMDDAPALCEEFATSSRSITCSVNGTDFTIDLGMGTAAECEASFEPAPATCTMTVGDLRACVDAFAALTDEEGCAMTEAPAACAPMMDAACAG